MRRASDGGSNISLFNQYYFNKQNNPSSAYMNNKSSHSEQGSPKNPTNEDDSCHIELDNLNIEGNSNEDEETNEAENENNLRAYRSSFRQRGSITSGIPIFSVTSPSLSSKQLGSQSSEDEDTNTFSGGSNSSMKYQRKSSKSRHEPYLDNSSNSGGSINLNANATYCMNIGKTSPPYRTRQREPSFSGTNPERFNSSIHRGSEPNPFDLILANM